MQATVAMPCTVERKQMGYTIWCHRLCVNVTHLEMALGPAGALAEDVADLLRCLTCSQVKHGQTWSNTPGHRKCHLKTRALIVNWEGPNTQALKMVPAGCSSSRTLPCLHIPSSLKMWLVQVEAVAAIQAVRTFS